MRDNSASVLCRLFATTPDKQLRFYLSSATDMAINNATVHSEAAHRSISEAEINSRTRLRPG